MGNRTLSGDGWHVVKRVEAFPTSKQDSAAVAKALLNRDRSEMGNSQKNQFLIMADTLSMWCDKAGGSFLGMDMRTHCSYAPSSGGAVERQNQTIKNKLAKCCEETGLTWLKALPIVLMYMRMRKRVKTQTWAHLKFCLAGHHSWA